MVILDRHWVTECVYGPIFRGGPAYSNDVANDFDERICSAPGVYVLCVPLDAQKHLQRFERLKTERKEAFDKIEQVVQRYQDLLRGNIAHPGNNLVDQYIRYQDFCSGHEVVHYDVDRDGMKLDAVCDRIVKELRI